MEGNSQKKSIYKWYKLIIMAPIVNGKLQENHQSLTLTWSRVAFILNPGMLPDN
jgi:hypothetical protein